MAWHSTHHFEAIFGVFCFLALLVVPLITSVEDAEAIPHWFAVHYQWLVIPPAILFAHLVMKAVHEKYREVEAEYERLRRELEERAARNSALQAEASHLFHEGCGLVSDSPKTQLEFDGWSYRQSEFKLKCEQWAARNFGVSESIMKFSGTFNINHVHGQYSEEHGRLVCQVNQIYLPGLRSFYSRHEEGQAENHV